MKTVAFVPIKMNNERLANKNTMPFDGGQPLIHYILESLKKVESVDEIYVYCSNEAIKDFLPEGVKYLTRDIRLDTSEVSFNDVLTSFADDVDADVYVLTHATAPFIKAESIDEGIKSVVNGEYDSAVGVHLVQEFLWRDGSPLNYDLKNIPRTQDLPKIYAETCGLYIYEKHLIKEQKRRIGDNPYFVELSKIEATDINDKDDFIIANAIFQTLERD